MKHVRGVALMVVALTLHQVGSVTFRTKNYERKMADGDFEMLNDIFENASIVLPNEYQVSQKVGIATLNMNVRNIKCYDLSVGDIHIAHEQASITVYEVNIGLRELDLTCEMDYEYTYGVVSGDGWVQIHTDDNSATSMVKFTSSDFDQASPVESTVEQCFSDLKIMLMDFSGDIVSEIIEIFQGLIRNSVESAIGDIVCNELSQIGTALVGNVVKLADEKLKLYTDELGESFTDPLYPERNLDLPSSLLPLDLQDTAGDVGMVFDKILRFVDTSLGAIVSDPSGTTATGNDLAINLMLRSLVLDDDRAFTVDTTKIPMIEPILFQGHDRITQFTMALNRIRVLGLDTFVRLNSFRTIGKHTIQNQLTWNSLTIEFDVKVDIKPSSLDDAILTDPTSPGISEQIVISFHFDQVDTLASLLLVLDEEAIGSMELGPLFYTENILPCLLSAVHTVEIAGLDVDPKYIRNPTISGFLSPGLNRVLSDAGNATFSMYSGVLRNAIPNIFQSRIRDLINTGFLDAYESKSRSSVCPNIDPNQNGNVDFRALFDSQAMTYGDVPPLLKEALDTQILSVNPATGRPRINEILVVPLTKYQSGKEGTLRIPTDLVSFVLTDAVHPMGLDFLGLKIFDPAIENIDTLSTPIQLLSPNATNGHQLDNLATVGTDLKSLRIGLKVLVETEGDPAFAVSNEIDVFVEVSESNAWASVLTKLDANTLFDFPLKDITNPHCWLNILATPQFLDDKEGTGFAILTLLLSAHFLKFDVSCSECSSSSLSILPEIMGKFNDGNVSTVLGHRLFKMGLDLLQGDFTQSFINRHLMDSVLRCPHSSRYAGPGTQSTVPISNEPTLSHDDLETLALAMTLVFEVAVVVAVEAHKSFDTNTTTPLSAQHEIIITDRESLVNFSSLEGSLGKWGLSGREGVLGYLTETVDDPTGPNGSDMQINSLLRSSSILDGDGYYIIKFDDYGVETNGTDISFKEIKMYGLDSIIALDVVKVLDSQTIQNEVTWKKIGLEFVISLALPDSSINGSQRRTQTKQDVTVRVELSTVHLSISMFLAFSKALLGDLELQSMLEIKSILPCLLTTAQAASVTEIDISLDTITKLSIAGFQSKEVQDAADKSTQIMLDSYGDKIVDSIPKILDSSVRMGINNWMKHHMAAGIVDSCNSLLKPSMVSDSNYLDLRDLLWTAPLSKTLGGSGLSQYGDLFGRVIGFVRSMLKTDDVTGLSRLNDAVVIPLTEAVSNSAGMLYYTGDLFNGGAKVKVGALDADIRFRVFDAKIENLDTIGDPVELFGGVVGEAYNLNNTISFGVKDDPLRLSSTVFFSLDGEHDLQVRNEISFSLEIFDANVILETMTKISQTSFFEFPLRNIFNPYCWLATIPSPLLDSRGVRSVGESASAALASLEAQIRQIVVTAQCTNCSSPRMSELTQLLSDPAAHDETTIVANALLGYIAQLLGGNFLQVQIDRLLNYASVKCPHSPSYDPNASPETYDAFESPDTSYSTTYLILLGGLTLAGIIIATAVVFAVRYIVRRRHRKWVAQLPPHQVRRLAIQQQNEATKEDSLNATTSSMFQSKEVPFAVRWMIPVIILLNIGLFLSGHLSLGATVHIKAQVAGETFTLENFFEFSIAQSTVAVWNAGGKALAILIIIFSGIWPYTKLLMTLFLWFLSPTRVSIRRRGALLTWLDWLAKWSMIDVFVLVISIAAFRVSIVSPNTPYLPADFYSVEMMVIPLWGFYANMLAQLVSQISSHVISYYHRKIHTNATRTKPERSLTASWVEAPDSNGQGDVFRAGSMEKVPHGSTSLQHVPIANSGLIHPDESQQKESINKHQFSRPHRGETEKLVPRKYVNKLLPTLAMFLIAMVTIGCALPSFSLELLGLVGVAVEFGQDFQDSTTAHSVFSVVGLLFQQASYLDTPKEYIGLGAISIIFLCTLLLVPAIQTFLLLNLWFTDCSSAAKQKMTVRLEIVQAWQYLEVYLVALFVSSWQLGPVSDFMINSYCDNLGNMFAQMVYYGVLKEEDAQCFSVTSHVESGAFFLAAGAIVLCFVSTFVLKAAVQYLRDITVGGQEAKEQEICCASVDGTTYSEDDGELPETGFCGTIHPVPVLFTDSFRWMLKPDDTIPSSSRALFGYLGTSHWSLPEATVVVEESSPCDQMIKGTYARDLSDADEITETRCPKRASSKKSVQSKTNLGLGKKLTFDEESNGHSNASTSYSQNHHLQPWEMDQQSIPSKMGSLSGSSFKDEWSMLSEAESLAYSFPSSKYSSSVVPPRPESGHKASLGTSARSASKAPPPYCNSTSQNHAVSATSCASPFVSYFDQRDNEQHRNHQREDLNQPSPSSFPAQLTGLKKRPMSEDNDEDLMQFSMDESEVTSDYFKIAPNEAM